MTVPSGIVTYDSVPLPLTLHTSDGIALEAEVRLPDPDAVVEEPVTGAVVLAHPHPLQGGSMTSLVSSELFRLLPLRGIGVVRFNFRGVGKSEGQHGDGRAESLDITAAIDALIPLWPQHPLVLCGWSFGADVSLSMTDDRLEGWVGIAPPLRILPREEISAAAGADSRPKLLIIPEHDQFLVPEAAAEATKDWANTRLETIKGGDHFLVGRTDKAARLVASFLTELA